ncbi:MAG TPA: phosphatase PAP2 family protein [Acidimicrobiales bacterium]|nr:phosphatase PAP2 family protein [Acidimicrobiales bacterium]
MEQRPVDLTVAALAAGALALGAWEARRGELRAAEARWFSGVNGISERWLAPAWVVMQAGSLGGALGIGGAVAASGHRDLGRRLALVGSLAWAGSKLVKPLANRGRPSSVVEVARILGRAQTGLGYPSGHAAVAVAMATAAGSQVPPAWKVPTWSAVAVVAAARIYVGAHLPLDVAGGAALGLATERIVRVVRGPAGRRAPQRAPGAAPAG